MNNKFYCFLLGLLVFSSCTKAIDIQNQSSTYLVLGDSYTIGESVKVEERYPNQVVGMLRKEGVQIDDPVIIAKTGWTTSELMNGMEAENIKSKKFDFVSLLIGVNNQYRGQDIDRYEIEFRVLLSDAIDLAKGNKKHVFVVSIPDWGVTPFGLKSTKVNISQSIDVHNAVNERIANEMGITYIEITKASRKAKEDTSLIAEDGLHPSGKMYKQWSEEIIRNFNFRK
jgi:lysophospholipase L1-like esterase